MFRNFKAGFFKHLIIMIQAKITYKYTRKFTNFNDWIDHIFNNQRQA